jgi:hypothetical protein
MLKWVVALVGGGRCELGQRDRCARFVRVPNLLLGACANYDLLRGNNMVPVTGEYRTRHEVVMSRQT